MRERKYKVIRLFFVISVVFLFAGLFIDENMMKYAALGIILLAGLSTYMTWVQPSFLSEKSVMFNLAVATSHSFVFLAFSLGLIFMIDQFVIMIQNMMFAIFGSVFLSIIVSSLYMAYKLRMYN